MTDRLRINEIFKSIQGESTWAGLPCAFVRTTGCNLRCAWCDTAYAFYEGTWLTIQQIVERLEGYHCKLAMITGGEPLLQPSTPRLAQALLEQCYTVLVETSGERPIDILPKGAIRIMDLKCPDSNESQRNDWANVDKLCARDEIKFVLASRRDYDWARQQLTQFSLHQRVNAVLMSVVFGRLEPRQLAEWILEDNLPVRMQLQLHKQIWEPTKRGV